MVGFPRLLSQTVRAVRDHEGGHAQPLHGGYIPHQLQLLNIQIRHTERQLGIQSAPNCGSGHPGSGTDAHVFHLPQSVVGNASGVAAVFLLVIFADILVVNLIKIPWGRARMRLVAVDDRAYFMPWWQPGKALRDTLVAAGVAAEEFKSFPSGHSANASSLMLLCLLPQLSPKLAGKRTALFLVGFAWTSLVAASRIVMGAHYLTDTIVGFAVGLLMLAGLCHSLLPVQIQSANRQIGV